jgi:hypothetical protein
MQIHAFQVYRGGRMKLKLFNIGILWLIIMHFSSASADAVQGSVKVEFLGSRSANALTKAKFKKLKSEICRAVGPNLVIGRGLYGSGIFDSWGCSDVTSKARAFSASWVLEIVGLEGQLRLQLRRNMPGSKPVSTISVKHDKADIEFFTSSSFASLTVYALLEQLGAVYPMSREEMIRAEFQPKLSRNFLPARWKTPGPANRLIIKMADPNIAAKSVESKQWYVGPPSPSRGTDPDPVVATAELDANGSTYKIQRLKAFSVNDKLTDTIYVAPEPDKNLRMTQIQQSITLATEDLADASAFGLMRRGGDVLRRFFLSSSANGHVGIRVGAAVGNADSLFRKSKTVGVLAEVRSGPIAGARLYYDSVPLVKDEQAGLKTSLSMNRVMAGYSLGYAIPKYRLRLDATPKLGGWSFDADLPVEIRGVRATIPFHVKSRLTLGIDLGAEYVLDVHTVRLWYGKDRLFPIIGSIGGGGHVSSSRFGLDYYWANGPKFRLAQRNWLTTALVFVGTDQISAEGSGTGVAADGTEFGASQLNYQSTYAGLGMALSW